MNERLAAGLSRHVYQCIHYYRWCNCFWEIFLSIRDKVNELQTCLGQNKTEWFRSWEIFLSIRDQMNVFQTCHGQKKTFSDALTTAGMVEWFEYDKLKRLRKKFVVISISAYAWRDWGKTSQNCRSLAGSRKCKPLNRNIRYKRKYFCLKGMEMWFPTLENTELSKKKESGYFNFNLLKAPHHKNNMRM